MRCSEFEPYAAQYLENELPAGSPAAAHVRTCPRCAARVSDLERIVSAAATLPGQEPPERVWISHRARMGQDRMFRRSPSLLERLGLGTAAQPGSALATLAICALATLMLFTPSRPAGPEHGGSMAKRAGLPTWSFPSIHQQLATAEAEENNGHSLRDPEVAAAYRQDLALVDNMIGVCQKSVDENPEDEMARDYLLAAYQQKADLLNALSERDALGA